MYKNSNKQEIDELDKFYSTNLKFLWEQYIKFLNLGIILSGITISIILKEVIFTKVSEINKIILENILYVKISTVFAIFAGILFILCRWTSQILMERQIYAESPKAKKYFSKTDTKLPLALEFKIIKKYD